MIDAAGAGADRPFVCPIWPECGCPEGGVQHDCPGLVRQRGFQVARRRAGGAMDHANRMFTLNLIYYSALVLCGFAIVSIFRLFCR